MSFPLRTLSILLAALAACLGACRTASATSYNWTGTVPTFLGYSFNNPANWSPGSGPPGNGDMAFIAKNHFVLLAANTGAMSLLSIGGGAQFFTLDKSLNVTNSVGFTEVIDKSALVVQDNGFFSFATDSLSLRLGGELRMAGGAAVATFVIRVSQGSLISGHGTVGATVGVGSGLDLAGTIRPQGGDLSVSAGTAAMDLDGNSAGMDLGGMLDVIYDGDLDLTGDLADPFSGRMDIGNNNRVEFHNDFEMDGQLNVTSLTSNRLVAPTIKFLTGADITVQAADASFEGVTTFNSGSTVFLLNAADDLRLVGNATIASGVAFSGAGNLQLSGGGSVTLLDNAAIAVRVLNTGAGEIRLGGGATAADATLGAYQQNASSDLRIEIGGLMLTQFDHLAITSDAALGGVLAVSMINAFTLSAAQSFEILDIGGVRTGQFAGLAEGAKVGTFGKDLFITYAGGDGNDVVLFTKYSADFNGDNAVDGDDFLIWQRNLGKSSGALNSQGNADGDGDVDAADLVAWRAQFGSKSPVVAAALAAPEPTAAVLLLFAIAPVFRRRRR